MVYEQAPQNNAMKVLSVFGTRPEAIKMVRVVKAFRKYQLQIGYPQSSMRIALRARTRWEQSYLMCVNDLGQDRKAQLGHELPYS
jgi:hypothetical protein